MIQKTKSIVLGGGCFWCLEAPFQMLKGVLGVVPGYAGGHVMDPTYEQVVSGKTGHAEVVKVSFNPTDISLDTVLAVFWTLHDPTSLNRQGADVGTQYASVILYTEEEQKVVIDKSLAEAQAQLAKIIITRVEHLENFYEAEDYHKNYYLNNKNAGYCQVAIEPKLKKMRLHFSTLLNC